MSSYAPLSTLRWLGPLGLLLAEYLLITLQFDALPLLHSAGLSGSFGHLGIAAPLLLVVATVVYVLAGERFKRELAQAALAPAPGWQVAGLLALNLASYAGLLGLTAASLGLVNHGHDVPLGWLGGWLLLAAATAFSLLFVSLPPRAALALVRSSRELLLVSAGAGALAWFAGVASGQLWNWLRALTLDTVYMLISPFSDEIGYAPEDAIIGIGDFFVVVAPECSGLEGIGLIVVVFGVYVWSARERLRMPRALLLVPLGVLLIWLANALRIALLLAVGVHLSPEIALSGFHSKAGWLFFCAISLCSIAYAERSPWWNRAAPHAPPAERVNLTAAYLTPQLALLATSLLSGLFVIGELDRWYGFRVVAASALLYVHRAQLPKPSWPASWQAPLLGVLGFGLWYALLPKPPAADVELFRSELGALPPLETAIWLAVRVLGACLIVPLAEELAFRGYLLRRMISADFEAVPKTQWSALALAGSSLAFGLLHGAHWLPATLCGVLYAYAQRMRGLTSDAVVAHAITNGLIALLVLAGGAYWLWM